MQKPKLISVFSFYLIFENRTLVFNSYFSTFKFFLAIFVGYEKKISVSLAAVFTITKNGFNCICRRPKSTFAAFICFV